MSIPVSIEALAEAMTAHPYAYLLTVSDDGRPHAVAVVPLLEGGALTMNVGHRSSANASARPDGVSVIWPPAEAGGYSLIVDGHATAGLEAVTVIPTKAVLHRPAAPAAGPAPEGSCGSDCVPLSAG
jgi:hypothetical protein